MLFRSTTRGRIVALGTNYYRKKTKSVFEIVLDDGTARLHCRWWNLPFMEKYFQLGDEVFVYGKPNSLKPRTIDHPETEVIEAHEEENIHLNRITPVYPLTEGLPQRWLRSLIWRTLEQFEPQIVEPWPQLQAGRVTPCAPSIETGNRRARSDAPYQFPSRANAIHTQIGRAHV